MSDTDWLVALAGASAIAWVNWYFFFGPRSSAAAATVQGGAQEVTIGVRGGYDPPLVRVRKGVPVRLVFDRQESSSCSEEIVIPEFGVRKYLPAYDRTAVEITPTEAGSFDFTCGMGMLRGKLIVEDREG